MYFQKILISAVVVLTPLASAAVGDEQNWDSAKNGQRGITICPEPHLQNGTREKTDVCMKISTSEGKPVCLPIPVFANNAGGDPRISMLADQNNTCLLFVGNACQVPPPGGVAWYLEGSAPKESHRSADDVFRITGSNNNINMIHTFMCSMKGYDHAATFRSPAL